MTRTWYHILKRTTGIITLPLLFTALAVSLVAGCQKEKAPEWPTREYTGVVEDRFGFAGVDLLPFMGNSLERVQDEFQTEINIDEEVGVAFVDVFGRPKLPAEWGLRPGEHKPSISFLSPGVPDENFKYSFDMTVQEASISAGFLDGYTQENLEKLLEDAFRGIRLEHGVPQFFALEFMDGNDIKVTVDDRGLKGDIRLVHRDGSAEIWMRITNQKAFFG